MRAWSYKYIREVNYCQDLWANLARKYLLLNLRSLIIVIYWKSKVKRNKILWLKKRKHLYIYLIFLFLTLTVIWPSSQITTCYQNKLRQMRRCVSVDWPKFKHWSSLIVRFITILNLINLVNINFAALGIKTEGFSV